MKGKDKIAKEFIQQLSTSQKLNHLIPNDFTKSIKSKISNMHLSINDNGQFENNSDIDISESGTYSTINIDNEYEKNDTDYDNINSKVDVSQSLLMDLKLDSYIFNNTIKIIRK